MHALWIYVGVMTLHYLIYNTTSLIWEMVSYAIIFYSKIILQSCHNNLRLTYRHGLGDHSRFCLSCLGPLVYFLPKPKKKYLAFQFFDIEREIYTRNASCALNLISTFYSNYSQDDNGHKWYCWVNIDEMKWKKQEIPHCRNSSKILSKNRGKRQIDPPPPPPP